MDDESHHARKSSKPLSTTIKVTGSSSDTGRSPDLKGRDALLAHVAEKIQGARQLRGLTQDQLAAMAGCAPLTITHVESGRRNPTLKSLAAIALALELDISDLFPRKAQPAADTVVTNTVNQVEAELDRIGTSMVKIRSLVAIRSDHVDDGIKSKE